MLGFFPPGKPGNSSVEEAAQPAPFINTREDIIFLQNPLFVVRVVRHLNSQSIKTQHPAPPVSSASVFLLQRHHHVSPSCISQLLRYTISLGACNKSREPTLISFPYNVCFTHVQCLLHIHNHATFYLVASCTSGQTSL